MSTSTIDPRIRERRAAVQRNRGRQRLRRLGYLAATGAAAAGLWGITRTPLLDIDRIAVNGAMHSGVEEIRLASGLQHGDHLLTVPLDRVAARLAELPWVASARARRDWPGTVQLDVIERIPVAVVPAQGQGWILLDGARRQLAHVPGPPPEVVRLEVEALPAVPGSTAPRELDEVLALAESVPEVLRDRIVALRAVGGREVDAVVRLGNGTEAVARLGRPRQPSRTWLSLAAILDDASPTGLNVIDLRVPGAPVLTRA